jgi:peptidoglycan/xylan/chitin deacetylase (PgdA/CDA1 family)
VRGNSVALTFDDGPVAGVTDPILDHLKRHGARATFFQIGRQIELHPDLARRVVEEGHEVGNHTATHPRLSTLDLDGVRVEIEKTEEIIKHQLPRHWHWFRPPFACLRQEQLSVVKSLGLTAVYWSVNSKDWKGRPAEEIAARVLQRVGPGDVILLHDRPTVTVEVVALILRGLDERGLRSVTLSELFPQ